MVNKQLGIKLGQIMQHSDLLLFWVLLPHSSVTSDLSVEINVKS